MCSCVCLATEEIDSAIGTCVRQYRREDQASSGNLLCASSQRWKHLTYFPSEYHDAGV